MYTRSAAATTYLTMKTTVCKDMPGVGHYCSKMLSVLLTV